MWGARSYCTAGATGFLGTSPTLVTGLKTWLFLMSSFHPGESKGLQVLRVPEHHTSLSLTFLIIACTYLLGLQEPTSTRSGGRGDAFYDLRLPWPLQSNLQLPAETHSVQAHALSVTGPALGILVEARLEIDVTALD